jgi:hypothetical protein
MGADIEGDAIEKLRKDVNDLRELMKLSDGLRRDLRSVAEEAVLESPLIVWGKWALSAVILVGFAVWFGGAIYGGIQIKSLQQQVSAAEPVNDMRHSPLEDYCTKSSIT